MDWLGLIFWLIVGLGGMVGAMAGLWVWLSEYGEKGEGEE